MNYYFVFAVNTPNLVDIVDDCKAEHQRHTNQKIGYDFLKADIPPNRPKNILIKVYSPGRGWLLSRDWRVQTERIFCERPMPSIGIENLDDLTVYRNSNIELRNVDVVRNIFSQRHWPTWVFQNYPDLMTALQS